MSQRKQPLNIGSSSIVIKEWLTKQGNSLSHPSDLQNFEVWQSQVADDVELQEFTRCLWWRSSEEQFGNSQRCWRRLYPLTQPILSWCTSREPEKLRGSIAANTKLQDTLSVHQNENGWKIGEHAHNGMLLRAAIYWTGVAWIKEKIWET